MGLLAMLFGIIMFFLSLDIAFSDRFGKNSKNFVPVILVVSIGLFCIGVILFNQSNSGKTTWSTFTYTSGSQVNQQSGESSGSGLSGNGVPKYSKGNRKDDDNDRSKQKPKGWANGLGGTFEKWKDLFGPPDEVELIDETGKAFFQGHYLQANFSQGKVSSFRMDFQKLNTGGYKLDAARKEVNQLIPPDSKLLDTTKSDDEKLITELYLSKSLEKELSDVGKSDLFHINYHILDSGKVYMIDVGIGSGKS